MPNTGLMTGAEARKCWCPFARYLMGGDGEGLASVNRQSDFDAPPMARCIASDCMAWRWAKGDAASSGGQGFCGLAGHPFPMITVP
jgi:hypothetical protein